jgi:hypothetical protein
VAGKVGVVLDGEPAVRSAGDGEIAVKVINHYGDEVLKVVEVTQAHTDERRFGLQ